TSRRQLVMWPPYLPLHQQPQRILLSRTTTTTTTTMATTTTTTRMVTTITATTTTATTMRMDTPIIIQLRNMLRVLEQFQLATAVRLRSISMPRTTSAAQTAFWAVRVLPHLANKPHSSSVVVPVLQTPMCGATKWAASDRNARRVMCPWSS
ncbi:Hypothetical protein PHPALM_10839, partial [Phytophthora palmivora]